MAFLVFGDKHVLKAGWRFHDVPQRGVQRRTGKFRDVLKTQRGEVHHDGLHVTVLVPFPRVGLIHHLGAATLLLFAENGHFGPS